MKKLTAILLSILMLISVFASCGGDDKTTTEISTTAVTTTEAPTIAESTTDAPSVEPMCEYNIFYELNGGTNNSENPATYKKGEHVHLAAPKKEGYAFGGWYTDPEFKNRTSLIGSDSEGDVKFYAKWNDVCGPFVLELEGDSYTIVKFDFSASFNGIPSSFNGKPITKIGNDVFKGYSQMTSLIIPDNITYIGNRAFNSCYNLKSVTIPNSVTSPLNNTFVSCQNLTQVTIGAGVPSIDGAFDNCRALCSITVSEENTSLRSEGGILYSKDGKNLICFPAALNLTTYEIPDGVTEISDNAFYGAKLVKEIKISKTLKNINENTFIMCDSIEGFTVDSENADFKSVDGVLFSKDGTKLIRYPVAKKLSSYTIPEGVTSIGKSAFDKCSNLKSIIIPKTVNEIGAFAFRRCTNLESIEIPNGVTKLEGETFARCSALKTVTLPDSIKTFGFGEFENCKKLVSIKLPDGLTVMGESAFSFCEALESINIPEGLTKIEYGAFYNCSSLQKIELHSGIKSIGDYAFTGCQKMHTAILGDAIESIGDSAFSGCKLLNSIIIPDNVTKIAAFAFLSCENLTSIKLSKNITEIGVYAFSQCGKLQSLYISKDVAVIRAKAFANCTNLTLYCEADAMPENWYKELPEEVKAIVWGAERSDAS